jgi:hypothetical protein
LSRFTGEAGGNLPAKCSVMNDEGQLPTCTSTGDGHWEVSYPEAPDSGIPGAFIVLFFVFAALGVAGMVWRVSAARRMAERSGMDPDEAAAMTMFTDDGFEATYLASNLRQPTASATPATPARGAEDRLAELQSLRDRGVLTDQEYAARRQAIIDSI